MLQRMYTRWGERHGMKVELIDHIRASSGIKSATLLIKGENAYGNLKTESGVPGWCGSVRTTARRGATPLRPAVGLSEVDDDIDIEVSESDLRIDTYRASGAGAHVNTTDSAVRITHVRRNRVACQNSDRSTRTAPRREAVESAAV